MFERIEVASPTRPWATAMAFLLNATFLTLAILLPLVRPDRLPALNLRTVSVPISAPSPETPANPRPPSRPETTAFRDTAFTAPSSIPVFVNTDPEPPAPGPAQPYIPGAWVGTHTPVVGLPPILATPNPPPMTAPTPRPVPKTLIVSHLDEGLLVRRVQPTYPVLAKVTHQEGTVVLTALISTTGEIEHLQVVSGPPLLARAALEAVSQWRYRPYILNGTPIEVQTEILVKFNLEH